MRTTLCCGSFAFQIVVQLSKWKKVASLLQNQCKKNLSEAPKLLLLKRKQQPPI